MATRPSIDVVVPTIGRKNLESLVEMLRSERAVDRILVADDRARGEPLQLPGAGVSIVRSGGRGPAAARNAGWHRSAADWVVFLDDDVLPAAGWGEALAAELAAAAPEVAGVQGRVRVPLPRERRATDWERQVKNLERAAWATADMAYRRSALAAVGGFDERFSRAYREDADLALRIERAGHRLTRGLRAVEHPPGAGSPFASLTRQRGNADDALMRRLHGRDWRRAARAPAGRLPLHALTVAAAGIALTRLATGRRRRAAVVGAAWLGLTAELALRRILPGPRTPAEIGAMAATSLLIPFAAVWHRLGGEWRARRVRPVAAAVLLDRDGTLIVDVPYNGDPAKVEPMPGARRALDRLRGSGIALAVVSNQSGIARGIVSRAAVERVNDRAEQLVGPIPHWLVCPHGPDDGCGCRKPAPALIEEAARRLGLEPAACVVVGDVGSDMEAARGAGARGILVPTAETRRDEVERAEHVAPTLAAAVDLILGGRA